MNEIHIINGAIVLRSTVIADVNLDQKKRSLIHQAKQVHKTIKVLPACRSLEDCFTEYDGTLLFWFNTADNSTHIMQTEL